MADESSLKLLVSMTAAKCTSAFILTALSAMDVNDADNNNNISLIGKMFLSKTFRIAAANGSLWCPIREAVSSIGLSGKQLSGSRQPPKRLAGAQRLNSIFFT